MAFSFFAALLYTQANVRAAASSSPVGLINPLLNTRSRSLPPARGPTLFNAPVLPSLAYGLVQLNLGGPGQGSTAACFLPDWFSV